jgi:uncharacterized iron-regulated membrane protein
LRLQTLHRWLGLTTGLVVLIVSLTGAIFVWEKELFALTHPELVSVEPGQTRRSFTELHLAAQTALAPGRRARSANVFADPARSVVFFSSKVDESKPTYFSETEYFDEVYVDPYTARVLGVHDRKHDPIYLTRMVHEHLLLGSLGTHVVGASTVVFILMVLSGLVLWWPRNAKVLRTRLRVRMTGTWKRVVYDSHNVVGFYVHIVLLILAVTGPVWTWRAWQNGIVWTLTGNANLVGEPVPKVRPTLLGNAPVAPMDAALRQTRDMVPDAERYLVEIPATATSILTVGAVFDRSSLWEEYERYYYHPVTAQLLGDERFEEKNLGMKWRNTNYGIHTGTLFGWPTQILATVACLVAASLPVTGFFIWFPRWRRARVASRGSAHTPESRVRRRVS